MVRLLTPHHRREHVDQIHADWLGAWGIRGLLVDLDSTLVDDLATDCPARTLAWLRVMRDAGQRLCVVSNSPRARVEPIVERIDVELPFVFRARKPLPTGFRMALRRMGLIASDVAVVGDQLFTDVLGGRLLGARTILVQSTIANLRDQPWTTRWKRPIERWLLRD